MDLLYEGWNNWGDDITKQFWEGSEKTEQTV